MIRPALALVLPALFAATPALAHPGHVAAQGGHTHWPALIALSAVLVIGVVGLVRKFARQRDPARE